MNNKHLASILSITLLFSCQKEVQNEGNNNNSNNVRLLTASPWKLTSFQVTVGTTTEEVFSDLEPCSVDGTITFKSDKTAILDEGSMKCEPADPQTITSTWHFSDNDTKLTLAGETATLLALTETELKTSTTVDIDGVAEVRVQTFKH